MRRPRSSEPPRSSDRSARSRRHWSWASESRKSWNDSLAAISSTSTPHHSSNLCKGQRVVRLGDPQGRRSPCTLRAGRPGLGTASGRDASSMDPRRRRSPSCKSFGLECATRKVFYESSTRSIVSSSRRLRNSESTRRIRRSESPENAASISLLARADAPVAATSSSPLGRRQGAQRARAQGIV